VSNGSGTLSGYSIEARSVFSRPQSVGDQIFDERWTTVHFAEHPIIGVPRGTPWNARWLDVCGLYDYAAAQALRWWFHANSAHMLCIETRIVKHEVTYTYSATRQSEHDIVNAEDRSSLMPDYGKAKE
jgi:hypothetical protein